jgi:ABC-type branched-subunit amino acid transport system substrate-binding protein
MPRPLIVLIAVALIAALATGCGEEGAAEGATVRIYVSAPMSGPEMKAGRQLCRGARAEAARRGEVEGLKLQVVCLDATEGKGRWTLARVGANARQATEDSTAIAYVGEPDSQARKQSRPIVDAAEIVEVGGVSGREAVAKVVGAIEEGDESEPRQAVFDVLG